MKRGIVLLSIGKPVYALWAHNMLVSIRANSSLPVYIVGDNYPAASWHIMPDKVIPMDREDMTIDGKVSIAKAKLSLWKYSDFEETIYLDIDGLLMRELDFEIDDFCIQVNGYTTKDNDNTAANLWVTPEQAWAKYGLRDDAKMPGTNSSFMAWTKEGVKVFQQALKNLSDPFSINELRYKWGKSGQQPDELYLNIAIAQLGIELKEYNVLYTKKRNKAGYTGLERILEKAYVLCCWGGLEFNHHEISGTGSRNTGLYNMLMKQYYDKIHGSDTFNDHFYSLIKSKIYERGL